LDVLLQMYFHLYKTLRAKERERYYRVREREIYATTTITRVVDQQNDDFFVDERRRRTVLFFE
jgi:hypothetical protein